MPLVADRNAIAQSEQHETSFGLGSGLQEGPPARTPALDRPIFLVGCVRSGTTLLRLMLDHHPNIAFDHEFEYAIDLIGDDGRTPEISAFHDYLRGHRIFQDSGYPIEPGLDYKSLADSFLAAKRDAGGKRLVGATVHLHFDRLLWLWPDARFIHLVRDGRDVSRSMVEIGFAGNSYAAVEHWIEVEQLWSELALRLPRHRWMEVRYEDLVADPEVSLRAICEFLEVDYDSTMFDYIRDSTYRMPSAKNAQRWKGMTATEVDLLEGKIAGMLLRRGYPLSNRPLQHVSATQHRRLICRHRLARAKFRISRYGPALFLADAITRRIGPASARRWVSSRIDRVDRRHLA